MKQHTHTYTFSSAPNIHVGQTSLKIKLRVCLKCVAADALGFESKSERSNESFLYAEAIRQVRRSPMCQRIRSVYFYSKVSIHHITAWFPDQLKVSLRWFFFKDINHECLLRMTCWCQFSPFISERTTPLVRGQILTPDPTEPQKHPPTPLLPSPEWGGINVAVDCVCNAHFTLLIIKKQTVYENYRMTFTVWLICKYLRHYCHSIQQKSQLLSLQRLNTIKGETTTLYGMYRSLLA